MASNALTPAVLVIADDLKLVDSLRGVFGDACRVFLSSSVESGLKRVASEPLCAVIINLAMPGMDAPGTVAAIRAAHGEVTMLGFTPSATMEHVDGCQVVSMPVDWKDLRGLIQDHIPSVPLASVAAEEPAPAPPPVPMVPEVPVAPPLAEKAAPEILAPEAGSTTTFLRDEAQNLEHANDFVATNREDGTQIAGRILRVSSHFVVCEVLDPQQLLTPGWVADEAVVRLARVEAYRGPARLNKVVNTGRSLIGEWALQGRWQTVSPQSSASVMPNQLVLAPFFDRMRILNRISEVFKSAVADAATVLDEARQCLERLEVSMPVVQGQSAAEQQRALLPEIRKELFPALDAVFARLEVASANIPSDLDAEYHSLVRQHLHPLLLCAPFIHHVYGKPLGFAGDYLALQKLVEEPYEGRTLYAKVLNAWLVLSPAGEAYRHRISLLVDELHGQAERCHAEGHAMRMLSIGCGAANEVARFIATSDLCNNAEFTLVDFNPETLAVAKSQVSKAQRDHWRQTQVNYIQCSIQNLIADASSTGRKSSSPQSNSIVRPGGYDFIHCTGLFDYFSDRVCKRLLEIMFQMLAPGGKLVVCNFTPENPIRYFMKYVLDWNLIHRKPEQLVRLAPPGAELAITGSPDGVEAYMHLSQRN